MAVKQINKFVGKFFCFVKKCIPLHLECTTLFMRAFYIIICSALIRVGCTVSKAFTTFVYRQQITINQLIKSTKCKTKDL